MNRGKEPKIRTREKIKNLAKTPRRIHEKKLSETFNQDRSIIKYSKIAELILNAREKMNKILSLTEDGRFQTITKSVGIQT